MASPLWNLQGYGKIRAGISTESMTHHSPPTHTPGSKPPSSWPGVRSLWALSRAFSQWGPRLPFRLADGYLSPLSDAQGVAQTPTHPPQALGASSPLRTEGEWPRIASEGGAAPAPCSLLLCPAPAQDHSPQVPMHLHIVACRGCPPHLLSSSPPHQNHLCLPVVPHLPTWSHRDHLKAPIPPTPPSAPRAWGRSVLEPSGGAGG